MKINLMKAWEQNQDLNFGEIRQVVTAANKAADNKAWEIRKAKFRALGKRP